MEPYIYRTSVGSRMRSIEWWHFQWPWWTPNPVYKVTWSQSQKRCILRTSFYRTLIGNHSQSMEWYHFQWPWVTRPRFQGHDIFEVEKWRVLKRKSSYYFRLIGTIPNIWNGTMFGDLDWPLNASRRFVSISWCSCYSSTALHLCKDSSALLYIIPVKITHFQVISSSYIHNKYISKVY